MKDWRMHYIIIGLIILTAIYISATSYLKYQTNKFSQEIRLGCIERGGALIENNRDIPLCIRPQARITN